MDSPEQRRKRKRLIRTSSPLKPCFLVLPSHLFSVRSLVLCFSFFTLLYVFSMTVRHPSLVFRPVLMVSSLSVLSSSSDSVRDFDNLLSVPIRIEDRILLPDHILLLVKNDGIIKKILGLDCVYGKRTLLDDQRQSLDVARWNVLSVDEYDEFRLVVRCPLPPVNYSSVVILQRRGSYGLLGISGNDSVHSWENVVYGATLDGDTAVVFVKGLNLRQERESDPRQFSCHFGLKNWEKDGNIMFSTKAITAAQEVVRCSLPTSIKKAPEKAQGIRVTIGVTPHVDAKGHENVIFPSVAKIVNSKSKGMEMNQAKYELCVCTMLWNQASALREWITYHAFLGVQRWFIYDNNSDDHIKVVIKELENYNVSRHVWPWIKTQEAGFSHCAIRAKQQCNWVSFMDVDEFFYFTHSTATATARNRRSLEWEYTGKNSLKALLASVSSSSPTIAEIRTTCHTFGPSGLNSPPSKGVTVGYTCRLQRPERHKSIIRPQALDTTLLNVVHHFHLKKGFRYLNLHRSIAVINHYKYQVWDVFKAKFYRRVATYVTDWTENHNEGSRDRAPGLGTEAIEPPHWSRQFCQVWDTGLRDLVLANLVGGSSGLLPWETSSLGQ